jgi:hypothetical protein
MPYLRDRGGAEVHVCCQRILPRIERIVYTASHPAWLGPENALGRGWDVAEGTSRTGRCLIR